MPTAKALVRVEFPVHALSESENWLSSKCCHFVKKNIFSVSNRFMQMTNAMYAKYQMRSTKALIQVEFPENALFKNTKSIMKKKNEKIMLSSKYCHFVKRIIFSVSNIFMQMFKVSTLCIEPLICITKGSCNIRLISISNFLRY